MKKILFSALFILSAITSQAQIDTLFWFAAPEVSNNHGDEPISLHFSTFSSAATVTVSIPANPGFTPITISLPANSYDRIVLDHHPNFGAIYSTGANQFKSIIENTVVNTPQNKGIKIVSDAPITCYYEVLGSRCDTWISANNTDGDPNNDVCLVFNTDIFSLKGTNALGTQFTVPGQNGHLTTVTDNWSGNMNGKNTIDIVATEPGTTSITITLPAGVAATGHTAGETFTISLTEGQTFSIEAQNDQVVSGSNFTLYSLAGTQISADKNIAVTQKDDSIAEDDDLRDNYGSGPGNGPGPTVYDLAGDQMIPNSLAGMEYIVSNGYVYITALNDNTQINQNGALITTINANQTYEIDLTGSPTTPAYITTSSPVQVYHLSVINGTDNYPEFGGAVIPQINCTGSDTVSFNRSTNEFNEKFFITILVKTSAINDFLLNGSATPIQASDFQSVPGTTEWSYMNKDMTSFIVTDSTHVITNSSEVFHLGTVNGRAWVSNTGNPGTDNSTGARYAYFSNFEQLIVNIDVSDQCITPGDSIQVGVANGFSSVDWSTGATSDSIWINTSGNYWVIVENSLGCTDSVNFNVVVNTIPQFVLNEDELLCPGTTFLAGVISGTVGTSATFEWTLDGAPYSTDSALSTTTPGEYILTVTNGCGVGSDTVVLSNWDISVPNIFTPNGDGINDFFEVPNLLTQGNWELMVVNRWGEQVYFNDAYDNTWNGMNQKNNELSEGTFFFYLIDRESEECNEYKGWVQIMR